jgi:hypothetical protein
MVETVGFRHMLWIVVLKSAKDRVFGLDTPGQEVPATCPVWNNLLTNYGCCRL